MKENQPIKFIPNTDQVMRSERVLYWCDGAEGALDQCIITQESFFPEGLVEYLNRHLNEKGNSGHRITITVSPEELTKSPKIDKI